LAKQEAMAVILILFGLGLTQLEGGNDPFYIGAGVGTVAMASLWLVILIVKDFKKKKK